MATEFASLPFDIVFQILQLLTVKELVRIGQTCKHLQDSVGERTVWATRESESLTLFPSILPSPLSTADLRRKLTQDAVIESQWQKDALALEELIKIYPRFESHLYAAEVLPGGEHILFVYFDGVLDLVRADSTVHLDNPGPISSDLGDVNQIHLELHRYRVSQSSEFGGYIVVELDLNCVRIYSFSTIPGDTHVKLLTNFSGGQDRSTRCWSRYASTFGCLYAYDVFNGDPHLYVSLYHMNTTQVLPPTEARFQLSNMNTAYVRGAYAFEMISDRRFIVAGPDLCIFVFDTATNNSARLSQIPLIPIWTFQCQVGDFEASPVFYIRSAPHRPMLRIAEGTELFHLFEFSQGTSPVEKHLISSGHSFNPLPAIGFSRAIWTWELQDSIIGHMLTLNNSGPLGSFEVPLDKGAEDMDNYSFDEGSGRISIMIKEASERICVLVFDTVPVRFRA